MSDTICRHCDSRILKSTCGVWIHQRSNKYKCWPRSLLGAEPVNGNPTPDLADRLAVALRHLRSYCPMSGDMALLIRANQQGGTGAAQKADAAVSYYTNLDAAHDEADAALKDYDTERGAK